MSMKEIVAAFVLCTGLRAGGQEPVHDEKLRQLIDSRVETLMYPNRLNRADKTYSLQAGAGLIGGHLQGGYWIDRDLQVIGEIYLLKDIVGGTSLLADTGVKAFFHNSFYIQAAAGIHAGKQIDYIASVVGEVTETVSYDGGLNFSIGNEWHLNSSWVLGGEWLGVYIALLDLEGKRDVQFRTAFFRIGYSW